MACAKTTECRGNVDFDVNGGLCVYHYVDWCLENEDTTPEEYPLRYKQTLLEVQLQMRLTDLMQELTDLIESDDFRQEYADDSWLEVLELGISQYYKTYGSSEPAKD